MTPHRPAAVPYPFSTFPVLDFIWWRTRNFLGLKSLKSVRPECQGVQMCVCERGCVPKRARERE